MRTSILTLLASASSVIAQSTSIVTPGFTSATTSNAISAQTSISVLFLKPGYAGSVVHADACGTTLAVVCRASICPSPNPTVTLTLASNKRIVAFSTVIGGVAGIASESCTLSGPATAVTKAVCLDYVSASGAGQKVATSATVTITAGLTYNPVAITANAQALSATTGVCSTSSGAVAAGPTVAVKDVYKVLVPVGAAMLALV